MGKTSAAAIRSSHVAVVEIDETDVARSQEYALLATLMVRAPDQLLLDRLAGITGDASLLGETHADLARAAASTDATTVAREYFALFVGVGRGEVLPYASYYLTGFLNERPLAAVRRDLGALGIAQADGRHDPEDHAALLLEVMGEFASGRLAEPGLGEADFFARHLAPWAGRFFADLERAPSARFYRAVGAMGAAFAGIEARAFALETAQRGTGGVAVTGPDGRIMQ